MNNFNESSRVLDSIGNIKVKTIFFQCKHLKPEDSNFPEQSRHILCILISYALFFIIRTIVFSAPNYYEV